MFIKLNCSQEKTCFSSSRSYLWCMFLCTSNLVPIKTLKKKKTKAQNRWRKEKTVNKVVRTINGDLVESLDEKIAIKYFSKLNFPYF